MSSQRQRTFSEPQSRSRPAALVRTHRLLLARHHAKSPTPTPSATSAAKPASSQPPPGSPLPATPKPTMTSAPAPTTTSIQPQPSRDSTEDGEMGYSASDVFTTDGESRSGRLSVGAGGAGV